MHIIELKRRLQRVFCTTLNNRFVHHSPMLTFLGGVLVGGLITFYKAHKTPSTSTSKLKPLNQKLCDQLIDALYKCRVDSKLREDIPGETFDEYSLGIMADQWSVVKLEFPHKEHLVGRIFLRSDLGCIHLLRIENQGRSKSVVTVEGFEGHLEIKDIESLILGLQKKG